MNYLLKYLTIGAGTLFIILALKKVKTRKSKEKNDEISFPIDISNFGTKELEVLTLENVILWFKEQVDNEAKPSQAILLRITDKNQIKGKPIVDFKDSEQNLFVQGFIDLNSKGFSNSRFIVSNKIDYDLKNQFGDDDMIVFE